MRYIAIQFFSRYQLKSWDRDVCTSCSVDNNTKKRVSSSLIWIRDKLLLQRKNFPSFPRSQLPWIEVNVDYSGQGEKMKANVKRCIWPMSLAFNGLGNTHLHRFLQSSWKLQPLPWTHFLMLRRHHTKTLHSCPKLLIWNPKIYFRSADEALPIWYGNCICLDCVAVG